jgi:hypothetical protein
MLLLVAVAVALGVGAASLVLHDLPEPSAILAELAPSDDVPKAKVEGKGGYSFRYPSQWKMQTDGAVSKVSSPDRRIVVSIGPGPAGTLQLSSERFIATLERQYRDVHVSKEGSDPVDGAAALLVSGTMTNAQGLDIRLFAVAMSESGRQYFVAGFSRVEVLEQGLQGRVREIAESFESTGAA